MRRFGEPVRAGKVYVSRPGAYAVVRDGGDVLVTEQAEPVREFQLPGGGIDPGEGALAALRRECLEETGWRIVVERRLGAYLRFGYMPEYGFWARKVCHVFLARPTLRVGEPTEPGHAAYWMPLATAVALVASDGDRAFLAAVAGRHSVRQR